MINKIVNAEGIIVSLENCDDVIRTAARRCYEANFLNGANDKNEIVRFDHANQADRVIQPAAEELDEAEARSVAKRILREAAEPADTIPGTEAGQADEMNRDQAQLDQEKAQDQGKNPDKHSGSGIL